MTAQKSSTIAFHSHYSPVIKDQEIWRNRLKRILNSQGSYVTGLKPGVNHTFEAKRAKSSMMRIR